MLEAIRLDVEVWQGKLPDDRNLKKTVAITRQIVSRKAAHSEHRPAPMSSTALRVNVRRAGLSNTKNTAASFYAKKLFTCVFEHEGFDC